MGVELTDTVHVMLSKDEAAWRWGLTLEQFPKGRFSWSDELNPHASGVVFSAWKRWEPTLVPTLVFVDTFEDSEAVLLREIASDPHVVLGTFSFLVADRLEAAVDRVVLTFSPPVRSEFAPRLIVGVAARYEKQMGKGPDAHGLSFLRDLIPATADIAIYHFSHSTWKANKRITSPNVVHLQVPPAQMPDFYRQIDFLLVPHHTTGLPLCAFEAIACGTEIIAPVALGAIERLLSDTDGEAPVIHYAAGDVQACAAIMQGLFLYKQKTSERVAEFSVESFSREILAALSTVEVSKEVVKQ